MSVRCAKCGSERVVPQAEIWDQGRHSSGSLHAYVYTKPDAIFFPGTVYATLYARICGDCGFTEIYAAGAAELYEAYRRSQSSGREAPPPPEPVPGETPPEPVPEDACLSCGKMIPKAAKACPECGWTWEAQN
jgi:hypothetical protein